MPEHNLRLLALDGGGVRGLSTLQIVKQLMKTIDPESPPKPCDYFDIIGGTSTGGLIAIMLGRLRMTVNECIDEYVLLSCGIFQKQRHRVTTKGQVQGRFNSDELERAIKEIVVRQGLAEDALLKDTLDAKCKVLVCATSGETGDTVRLTSYRSPRGRERLFRTTKIWEAGRATLAASSFFNPITIGDFEETFVDGAIGANNPVYELWSEAQDIWPSGSLKDQIKYLVSIGTGVPSLTPFKDDLIGIEQSLLAIATETERTAERFCRDKAWLDNKGRYYRFNVLRGLEDIGLEDLKRKNTIVAATDRYIQSQMVFKQMKACADSMSGREYVGSYRTSFSLQGVPVVNKFVDRPSDMVGLERALLPQRQYRHQKVFVLYGLGGIGKTQLAVEFARRHHWKFSSVFWLDGTTENSLKQSIATCASRIPEGQIAESSRTYSATGDGDIDAVVRDVKGWLSQSDNIDWLIVFDNVDRESGGENSDPNVYDVTRYIPQPDHGSVLITTRLAKLEKLGVSRRLGKLSKDQAQAIFQQRYGGSCDTVESEALLKLLDGLPLAVIQAASYLRQSGVGVREYIELYKQQWKGVMESQDRVGTSLHDYPDRSVWTTWTISYHAIRAKSMAAANLLLLWACLDNKDVWYGLGKAGKQSADVADYLSEWLPNIASNEVEFLGAVRLLRSYSLVEDVQDLASKERAWGPEHTSTLATVNNLGPLYADLGWLDEAEKMYQRVLQGKEKAWGLEHTSTLNTVNNLGNLYKSQGKLGEAEKMYQRALEGREKALGREHTSTLDMVNNLGLLYTDLGRLDEAEKMYQRALEGYEKALGPENAAFYIPALNTVYNLGLLFSSQDDVDRARAMYSRTLAGYQRVVGYDDPRCQYLHDRLGALPISGKTDDLADAGPNEMRTQSKETSQSSSRRHRLFNATPGRSPNASMSLHWLPELTDSLTSETWKDLLDSVPRELRWDLEFTEPYLSQPCWTFTPSSSLPPDTIPLTIAGAPVVIPVRYEYKARPVLIPPPDPHPKFVSPSTPLRDEIIEEIFDIYDNPLGFYVLVNGWLQIIIDDDFDSSYALSHRPQTFGGLRVSYIQQSLQPSASRTTTSPSIGTSQVTGSNTFASNSAALSPAGSAPLLRIGGVIEAKVKGIEKAKDRFQGRIGVMTECENKLYLTVSTHLMTEAWMAAKGTNDLEGSWINDTSISSACRNVEGIKIAHTFDTKARKFPNGFEHDTSLIDVTTLSKIHDALKCPHAAGWLSDQEWNELSFHYPSTSLHFLSNPTRSARNIPFLDSENIIIGQAIFNFRQKDTGKSWKKWLSRWKRSSSKPTAEDWRDYVAHALLFRVEPKTFGKSDGASGTSVCVLKEGQDGEKYAKIAGFTSFVQDVYNYSRLSMDDNDVKGRLRENKISFYGAFRVPKKLRDEHRIMY